MSFKCPECNNTKTKVTDSRPMLDGVYRRRFCMKCEHQFYTKETTSDTMRVYTPPREKPKAKGPVVTKKRKPISAVQIRRQARSVTRDIPRPVIIDDIPDVDRMTDAELDNFIYGSSDRFDDDDPY